MPPAAEAASPNGYWGIPTATIDWCEENYEVRCRNYYCHFHLFSGTEYYGLRSSLTPVASCYFDIIDFGEKNVSRKNKRTGGSRRESRDCVLGGPEGYWESFGVFTFRTCFMTQPVGRATYCQSKARYSWNIFRKSLPISCLTAQ